MAEGLAVDRFQYVSTCYVSSRYDGVFTGAMLAEGQAFNNHYERTKYEAEAILRERMREGRHRWCGEGGGYWGSSITHSAPGGDVSTHPGFHSLHEETATTIGVEGPLPEWLSGSLVRNGPGAFSMPGSSSVDHWFDGLAMCYGFTFDPGNRADGPVDGAATDTYRSASEGTFSGGFATGETTLRDRIRGLVTDPYDNTNIIVERVGDRYLALTKSTRRVEVDPNTLETRDHVQYEGPDPTGQLAYAQFRADAALRRPHRVPAPDRPVAVSPARATGAVHRTVRMGTRPRNPHRRP